MKTRTIWKTHLDTLKKIAESLNSVDSTPQQPVDALVKLYESSKVEGKKLRTMKKNKNKNNRKATMKKDLRKKRKSNKKK